MLAVPSRGEDGSLPFSLPVLDGWRTETILFPLEFAPELPSAGLEELRFAPGMFDQASEQFWSYAFVWWVDAGDPHDAKSLSEHLATYFRGLSSAVAEQRGFSAESARFTATLEAGEDGAFRGSAETLDAFVTRRQVRLNVVGTVTACSEHRRRAIFFALSPQSPDHAVWSELGAIRDGFRCSRPTEPKAPGA